MKKYSKDKDNYIRFRISSEDKFSLLMLAQKRGITLSEMILELLLKELEEESINE